MAVHIVDDQYDFYEQLKNAESKLVVVDFTSNNPCKRIAPDIENMAEEFKNVVFLQVDINKNEEIAAEYKITAMPTFVFIKKSKKITQFVGASKMIIHEMILINK